MRRYLFAAAFSLCFIFMLASHCYAVVPRITAHSAVLYDRTTKQILFSKKITEPMPPASTTKIMTAVLALELADPDEKTVVSKKASSVGGSSLYLKEGEVFSVEDLLFGTLLRSGNDAAVALAEAVGGSEEFFINLMNKKAYLLGARSTRFLNTNGLPCVGHVSTSYDLAVIADYALKNQRFADMVRTRSAIVPKNKSSWQRRIENTNKLLGRYPGTNGVKTGTTNAAGQCLVASAARSGRELISVVLKSSNRYGDTIRLLDYGFKGFFMLHIPEGSEVGTAYFSNGKPYQVPLQTAEDFKIAVPEDMLKKCSKRICLQKVKLPLKENTRVGYLKVYIGNIEHSIPVSVKKSVKKQVFYSLINYLN